MKEVRTALLALSSIFPMFVILWWTDSLDHEQVLYERFRERRSAVVEQRDVERLAYIADRLPNLEEVVIQLKESHPLTQSLAQLQQVNALKLVGEGGFNYLGVLAHMPQLQELSIDNVQSYQWEAFIGALKGLKTLYINNCQLYAIPPSLEQFTELRLLSLADNLLKESSLHAIDWNRLSALKYLNVSENGLLALPNGLFQHPTLIYLDASHNRIAHINPDTAVANVPLEVLRLEWNLLKALPTALDSCRRLRYLNAARNQLDTLAEIRSWDQLEDLRLDNNQLTQWPVFGTDMARLHTLSLKDNALTQSPSSITTDLSKMVNMEVYNNKIETLELGETGWASLEYLYVERNALMALPERLLRLPELHTVSVGGNLLELDEAWEALVKSRATVIQAEDLNFLPTWGTWRYQKDGSPNQ